MIFETIVEQLHNKAMEMADSAFISKQEGKEQEANMYFALACKIEGEAAMTASKHGLGQPTVGILFRSAATLASDTGDVDKILSLAQKALTTGLLKEQEEEILELIRHHRIRLHSLDRAEIDNLIYRRKMSKLMKLGSKTKGNVQKRKHGLPNKKHSRTDATYQGERQKAVSLL
jgi:hypothetical protein